MRCPKCGYISFDHLETCLKCNKDISGISSEVEGTTFNVEAPLFLKIQSSTDSYDMGEEADEFEDAEGDIDIVDPDLDVLVEEDEGIDFGGNLEESEEDEEYSISLGEDIPEEAEEEGLEIDLGQFGDFEDEEQETEEDMQISLPDELADISDLSPPDSSEMEVPAEPELGFLDDEGEGDFELNLDMEEMDDDFSLSPASDQNGDEAPTLSLDDIGLAEPASPAKPEAAPEDDLSDMDSDLDFELDLGDLGSLKE